MRRKNRIVGAVQAAELPLEDHGSSSPERVGKLQHGISAALNALVEAQIVLSDRWARS